MAGLAAKLKATGGVKRGSRLRVAKTPVSAERRQAAANTVGDAGTFVQTQGPRANQSYAIKRGKKGNVRLYDDGSKIGVPAKKTPMGTAGARSPRPAVLRNQRQSDVADTAAAATLYKRFLDKQRPSGVTVGPNGKQRKKVRLTGGTAAP